MIEWSKALPVNAQRLLQLPNASCLNLARNIWEAHQVLTVNQWFFRVLKFPLLVSRV